MLVEHRDHEGGPGTAPERTTRFVYTADDERIGREEVDNARTFWSVRDLGGKVLRVLEEDDTSGTFSWTKDYVWQDGKLVASEDPGTGRLHYHLDHLGTPRLVTDAGGGFVRKHDYFPFGQEVMPQNMIEVMRFTGHEKDFAGMGGEEKAGDLEYMHARYYSALTGRFLSLDPVGGSPRNPQSWNRYAYVQNSPMTYIDPTGETLFFFSTMNDNIEELEQRANENLFGVDLVIAESGEASLVGNDEFGPPTASQAAFADVLQTAIDSTSNIGLTVTRNNPQAIVGNPLGEIDIADMAMLSGTISGFAGALAHEVAEQTFLQGLSPRPTLSQLRRDPNRPSHLAGIAAQSAVAGAQRIRTTQTGQLITTDFAGKGHVTFIVRNGDIIKVVR